VFPAPQQTSFDLTFRLFGFPVRVHPLFWLFMAILGMRYFEAGFEFGLIWVACGFVSILAHELGHAFAIRWYGSPASIWLFMLGGLAVPTYTPSSPWRRLAIALAGPLAGFAILGLVWGSNELLNWAPEPTDGRPTYAWAAFRMLFFINLIWTLLNLLPVWPLDGGRACREILAGAGHRRPDQMALWVSVVAGGGLAVYGLLINVGAIPNVLADTPFWWAAPPPIWTIFLFLLAVQSYLLLQQLNRGARFYSGDDDDRLPWERRR
jgi:stage IV sporulation protein FB